MKKLLIIPLLIGFISTAIAQSKLSAEEAEEIVLDRYRGKVISTNIGELDNREVYVIQVLVKGKKIRTYHVDIEKEKLVY